MINDTTWAVKRMLVGWLVVADLSGRNYASECSMMGLSVEQASQPSSGQPGIILGFSLN